MKASGLAAAVCAAIFAGSCAQIETLDTREQWLSETSRTYQDRSVEQVIAASEAVIRSINPKAVQVSHNPYGFQARRTWSVFMFITAMFGTDVYSVKVSKAGTATRIDLYVTTGEQDTYTKMAGGRAISAPATYRLFFSWLDYTLGKSQEWLTCDKATEVFPPSGEMFAPGMCGYGSVSSGDSPVTPKPEWIASRKN